MYSFGIISVTYLPKILNLTKGQYSQLLEGVFKEFSSNSSELIFRRVYAQKNDKSWANLKEFSFTQEFLY